MYTYMLDKGTYTPILTNSQDPASTKLQDMTLYLELYYYCGIRSPQNHNKDGPLGPNSIMVVYEYMWTLWVNHVGSWIPW